VPDLDSLVPVWRVLRHALALPVLNVRLYFSALFEGRRRFSALALAAWAGLVSFETPRLGLLRSLVDCQRKSWLPRFVNFEPSITERQPAAGRVGLAALKAGLFALTAVDRIGAAVVPAENPAGVPASLATAMFHRLSSSPPFFSAHPSKSVEACAGSAVMIDRSRNSGTIETLM
jgi:hypothetical protein